MAWLRWEADRVIELDHVVIHIDDWEACNDFYRRVLGAEIVANPEGAGNPLRSVVYRVGSQQINVHGPWPGKTEPCCEPRFLRIGGVDLAFRTDRTATENVSLLEALDVEILSGPTRRFGASGWGQSVYCADPSGNGIELISYAVPRG